VTTKTLATQNGTTAAITIDRIEAETIRVPIVGTSPLITHRFSEKAKRQMLDKMQGRQTPTTPKNPGAEYESAFYRFEDGGAGLPVIAFKSATVGGGRFYRNLTMTELRQYMFFAGEIGVDGQMLARIDGDVQMREDVVRVQRGTDLRYRPMFMPWRVNLIVTFVKSALTQGSILSLIDAGGMGVGVGEWRPEKKGDFGTYQVDTTREIEVLS